MCHCKSHQFHWMSHFFHLFDATCDISTYKVYQFQCSTTFILQGQDGGLFSFNKSYLVYIQSKDSFVSLLCLFIIYFCSCFLQRPTFPPIFHPMRSRVPQMMVTETAQQASIYTNQDLEIVDNNLKIFERKYFKNAKCRKYSIQSARLVQQSTATPTLILLRDF